MLTQMVAELAAKAAIFAAFNAIFPGTGSGSGFSGIVGGLTGFLFGTTANQSNTSPAYENAMNTPQVSNTRNVNQQGDTYNIKPVFNLKSIDSKDAKKWFMTDGREAVVDTIDHAVKNRDFKNLKANN